MMSSLVTRGHSQSMKVSPNLDLDDAPLLTYRPFF